MSRVSKASRLSAGVVVVRRANEAVYFLLLRAYRNWDFPKGLVEAGEDPLDAARREVREEADIAQLAFTWGEQFIETGPYSRNKIARYYIAETASEIVSLPVNPVLGVPEHHEWRWCERDEALERVSPRLVPVMDWAWGQISRG